MSGGIPTRAQLIASHVAAGVAKWGEPERVGLEKQGAAKSTAALQIDHDIRALEIAGAHEDDIRDLVSSAASSWDIATGALDDGES